MDETCMGHVCQTIDQNVWPGQGIITRGKGGKKKERQPSNVHGCGLNLDANTTNLNPPNIPKFQAPQKTSFSLAL